MAVTHAYLRWTGLSGVKSKRACPGYRDAFEVNLRDETQSTIRKAKAKAAQKRKITTRPPLSTGQLTTSTRGFCTVTVEDISGPGIPDADSLSDGTLLSYSFAKPTSAMYTLPPVLQTPLDQQATCYFLSQYVVKPAKGPGRGVFTFLLKLLSRPDIQSTPLPTAFAAAALAALAGRPNSKRLLPRASAHYSRALKEVNTALKQKGEALSEASLASVIMLSMYEVRGRVGVFSIRLSTHADAQKGAHGQR